ncbi:guanine-N(7)--methyltransferase subunit TRM82 [Dendryphion nanum]|uniref:Guanine-N(7)--methyltransferase subunit TRM82 n=1 Tax=Dendryphion nanum TaxID=256645 RepID=A0A9P9DQV4_9PLEO|nr:guanine-N(7)--methyltransferase subunit TRM82 [Dendryphion nanum]
MALPFQCLQSCSPSPENTAEWIIVGASGSKLLVQSSSGSASIWPTQNQNDNDDDDNDDGERPGKRIKLATSEINTSNFTSLAVSNSQKYLVGITAEDKCIRVFQIGSDCRLEQLSQRCMARRPCAITLTFDDSTILCADKFGDVYSLPLLTSAEDGENNGPENVPVPEKQFKPSASVLTVHSGRNRKVLEEQLKQASTEKPKGKEPLKFKHELLLGHVSMLTDIAYTMVDGRSYIFTADRDEHIRISRGPPQAHIIEGFCQGHGEFVSRLCLVPSGRLVSGGGDANLFVWDWPNRRLLDIICIRDAVLNFLTSRPELAPVIPEDVNGFKIAVSGIWAVPNVDSKHESVVVTCEGVPALFILKLGGQSTSLEALALGGNSLDVTFLQSSQARCTVVVAIDNVHKAGSIKEIREETDGCLLECFSLQPDGQWKVDATMTSNLDSLSRELQSISKGTNAGPAGTEKALCDLLYGIENLRKRPGAED